MKKLFAMMMVCLASVLQSAQDQSYKYSLLLMTDDHGNAVMYSIPLVSIAQEHTLTEVGQRVSLKRNFTDLGTSIPVKISVAPTEDGKQLHVYVSYTLYDEGKEVQKHHVLLVDKGVQIEDALIVPESQLVKIRDITDEVVINDDGDIFDLDECGETLEKSGMLDEEPPALMPAWKRKLMGIGNTLARYYLLLRLYVTESYHYLTQ